MHIGALYMSRVQYGVQVLVCHTAFLYISTFYYATIRLTVLYMVLPGLLVCVGHRQWSSGEHMSTRQCASMQSESLPEYSWSMGVVPVTVQVL